MTMHLNVFIAKTGFCARRKADSCIKEGKVRVNGKVVREPWYAVKETDSVTVGGKTLKREEAAYLLINKPKGVTTTLEDKFAAHKITDIIPKKYGRVYPVGRLDKDSRGLLILTNDGELCYRLTHPKFEIEKEYRAIVKGLPGTEVLDALKCGVTDEGELLRVKSCSILNTKNGRTEIRVVVNEGKKRHIRRLFKSLGFHLEDLKRVRIGRLSLGDLREGQYKDIDKETIYRLTLR